MTTKTLDTEEEVEAEEQQGEGRSSKEDENSHHSQSSSCSCSTSSSSSSSSSSTVLLLHFLFPQDLLHLSVLSRAMLTNPILTQALEDGWAYLSSKRWNLPFNHLSHLLTSSTPSYRQWYRGYDEHWRLPDGKYSSAKHRTFGRGRQNGLCAWLFINHTADAELRQPAAVTTVTSSPSPSSSSSTTEKESLVYKSIELRVCLQNLSHGLVRMAMTSNQIIVQAFPGVNKKDKEEGKEDYDDTLEVSNLHIIARNGEYYKSHDEVLELLGLEFAVLAFTVLAPATAAVNEPEFITMIKNITLLAESVYDGEGGSGRPREVAVTIMTMEEDKVWKAYTVMPSGHYLLRAL
eukprot:gene718-781_t